MRRILTLLLLITGMWQTACFAYEETHDNHKYNAEKVKVGDLYYYLSTDAKVAKIAPSGDTPYAGSVNIPESMEYQGDTYSVKYIGKGAFKGCTGLNEVYLNDGIRGIERDVFTGCQNLTTFRMSRDIQFVLGPTFEDCLKLSQMRIPDIASWCRVYIEVPSMTFGGAGISDIFATASLCDDEGNVINELIIPNGVTRVYSNVFYGCQSLTSVTVPESVTLMEDYVFKSCI